MPRIRTIKPEFWADEKVSQLPRDARLLFIGLFNFADDEGRLRGNPLLIRSQIFPYDADIDSESLLRMLAERSLVLRYEVESESFIWIRNFSRHQKIDRPSASVFPPPPQELKKDSTRIRRTLVAGKERNREQGKDQGTDLATPGTAPPPTNAPWDSYSEAYERRHGAKPPDSAKGRSLLKQFLTRVPAEDAPAIAAFFLTHNDSLYVRAKHPIDLLLRDAPKLYTEWKTGRTSTATGARQKDQTQENVDSWQRVGEEMKRGLV